MSAKENVELVKGFFAAFGRGDLDAVIEAHTEDIDSQAPVTRTPCALPWAGPRQGRAEVRDYFRQIADTVRPEPFEDVVFTASGDRVVVEGYNKGTVLTTGKVYEHDWVMIFTIREGQVGRFRMYYDPADIETALTN
ncbi:MAG: nuclear transport factor 2 family protein [Acidimicrobiia bacterium]